MEAEDTTFPIVKDQRSKGRSTRYDRELILEQKLLDAKETIDGYDTRNRELIAEIELWEENCERVKKRLRLFNSLFNEEEISARILELKNREEFNSNPSSQENSSYE